MEAAEEGVALRRYLLDEMPLEEQAVLEQRYLGDDELFDQMRAAEDALIRDYWSGRLEASERERFETQYLASPLRRERAALVKSLMDYATAEGAAKAPAATGWRLGEWARVAAVIAVGLTVGLLVVRGFTPQPQDTSSPRPTASGGSAVPETSPVPHHQTGAWLTLQPGLKRSAGAVPATVPAGAGAVRLRLDVPRAGSAAYTIRVEDVGGRTVWRSAAVDAEDVGSAFAVFAEIPAGTLGAGDYVVLLRPVKPDPQADAEYFFRIGQGQSPWITKPAQ